MKPFKATLNTVFLATSLAFSSYALSGDTSTGTQHQDVTNIDTIESNIVTYSPFDTLNVTGEESTIYLEDRLLSEKAMSPLGYEISYTKWTPPISNGHTIIYNHGFQSHKDWFNGTAEYLSILGYTVYAFDRIGSGKSSGGITVASNDQGGVDTHIQVGHVDDWKTWTWTLDQMVALANKETGEQPITIWGNSFGAHIVTAYLNQYAPNNVAHAVFTTPGLFIDLPLPFTIEEFLSKQSTDYFPSTIPDTDGDQGGQYFTDDPFYLWAIRHDERSLREATQSFYFAVVGIGNFNRSREAMELDPLVSYPRFYLLAEQDTMMNNEKTLEYIKQAPLNATAKFYRASDNKHFLSFSSDMEPAVLDIHEFIQTQQVENTERLEVPLP